MTARNPVRWPARWSAVVPTPPPTLCLDFVNTKCWRGREASTETIPDSAALGAWAMRALALPDEVGRALHAWQNADPAAATALHADALALRELIHDLLAAVATGRRLRVDDTNRLNIALAHAPQRGVIGAAVARYGWRVELTSESAAGLLAPVLWSAGDLLAQPVHDRLRRCANPECLWLFLDDSTAGTRRWCDMGACGNRAKARRHYLRNKSG
jgi:predicted RNA-binding Zn ribbon-like protein